MVHSSSRSDTLMAELRISPPLTGANLQLGCRQTEAGEMPAQSLNQHTNSSIPASEPNSPHHPLLRPSRARQWLRRCSKLRSCFSVGSYLEVEPRRLMIITPIRSTDDTSGCRVCARWVSLWRREHLLPGCRITSPAQTHHLLLGIWVIGWRLSKCLTMAGVIDARRCRNFNPPFLLLLHLLLFLSSKEIQQKSCCRFGPR